MRIVRGSSLKGYAGFKTVVEKDTYKIVRPLIFMTKEEIKDYDDKLGIKYAIDASNFKAKYTRNRYRKVVLPFLKEEDKNVLKMLSKLLGQTDTDGQISQIEITENFLEGQIKAAMEAKQKNERLYTRLGTIVGLAIVIVLC